MRYLLILISVIIIYFPTNILLADDHYIGRYCEMDGAYTEYGEDVYAEFYMYSNRYGESDGAYTESGEYVYGECYIY